MLEIVAMKIGLGFVAALLCCVSIVRGDEQLFGFVRGAETLPAKGVDEPADGQTFAEETRQLFRLKVGFNF
jgi:hypothetical protein